MNKKGFAPLVIILIVVAVIVMGIGIFYYTRSAMIPQNLVQQNTTTTAPTQSTSSSNQNTNVGWQTYQDPKFHFEIQHPAGWIAKEYQEGTSTYIDISPMDIDQVLSSSEKVVRSYITIEPRLCEQWFAGPNSQTSTVSMSGISMEKIETGVFPKTTSTKSFSGRFTLYVFPGNPQHGWDAVCNTIRLYIPPVDASLGNVSDTQTYAQDKITEDQIFASFKLN